MLGQPDTGRGRGQPPVEWSESGLRVHIGRHVRDEHVELTVAAAELEAGRPVGTVFIGLDDGVHRLGVEHRLPDNPDPIRATAAAEPAVRAALESRRRLRMGAGA